jgi:hypothetical protein
MSRRGADGKSRLVAAVVSAVDGVPLNCPEEPRPALSQALGDVLSAYARVDADAFDRASRSLDPLLGCQNEVLPVEIVAEVHRTKALVAYAQGDEGASRASLTVARSLDAEWALDDRLFPEGHPLRAIFQEALTSFRTDVLDEVRGRWFVDGLPSNVAPLGYPFVLQGVDEAGVIVFSGYVPDIAAVPSLPVLSPDVRDVVLRVAVTGLFRASSGRQTGGGAGFDGGSVDGLSGGAALRVEADPLPVVGLAMDLDVLGGADPRHGGVGGDVRAHVAAGPVAAMGMTDLRFRARAGAALDTFTGWGHDAALPTVVVGPLLGVGLDLRRPTWGASMAWDGALNRVLEPYGWRLEGAAGVRVRTVLAAVSGVSVGRRGLEFGTEESVARRTEDEVRLWAGLAVWR